MAKQKKPTNAAGTTESKSMIQAEQETTGEGLLTPQAENIQEQAENEVIVRILFRGDCPKLTPRGVGKLEYEIGVNDQTDEPFLRIASNESSGVFSTHWIGINEIRTILDGMQDHQTFNAIILRNLYMQKSANNHGFLTAILKAEGVVVNLPKQLTVMRLDSWEPLMEKITSLKGKDISLPDHVGMAAKKRAEAKAKRRAERQAVSKKKKENMEKEALETAQAGAEEEV